MGRLNKCCVHGCNDVLSKRHRFPINNPNVFKSWLEIVKPKDWQILPAEVIHRRYYVCDAHFEDHYKVSSKRGLLIHSVPTLGVSVNKPSSKINCNQSPPEGALSIMEPKTKESISKVDPDFLNQPSTSKSNTIQISQSRVLQNVMEPISQGIEMNFHDYCKHEPFTLLKETRNRKVYSGKQDSILRNAKRSQLSQRELSLYKMLLKCREQLYQTQQELKSFQQRCSCIQNEGQ